MHLEQPPLIPVLRPVRPIELSSFRCGRKCHYKYDDGSECSGVCTRLGDEDHEGAHSCEHGSSHNAW